MTRRETAEVLLISAMINSQDVTLPRSFGMTPDYIEAYAAEYNWLLNYEKTYDCQPSRDVFQSEFPAFQMSEHEDVRSACDAVFKAFGRRKMYSAMEEASSSLEFGDLDIAWNSLQGAEPRRARPKMRKLLTDMEFLDDWDNPQSCIEVPYYTLQKHTGGMLPGNLWYLAARPGQGKTAHLVNIVKSAVLAGNRVRFFSLEMSEEEVRARFHAALATQYGYEGITLNSLRGRTVDRHLYKTFLGDLDDRIKGSGGSLDIHTPKNGSVSPGTVAQGADEYHLTTVDYIGLMKADAGNSAVDDWRLAAKISNSLKETALAASTRVLSASQINRDGDHGELPPKVKNLAQSDALGQDGDVVVTLRSGPHDAITKFSLEKNRHGVSGVPFYSVFDPNKGVFREISSDVAEDLVLEVEARL